MRQEARSKTDEKRNDRTNRIWRTAVPLVCASSLILYILFSYGLRYLFSSWDYHLALLKQAFPDGFLAGLLNHPQLIPIAPISHNGFLLLAIVLSCVVSSWLVHCLLRGNNFERGPHLILFSLAAAVIPTFALATIFWPDGRGKLTLEMNLFVSLFILVALIGLMLSLRPWEKERNRSMEPKNTDSIGWVWIFVPPLAVMFGFAYLRGYFSYGGYDAIFYHLPLAASWLKYSRLTRCFDIQCDYPGNAELMMRWGLIDGSDRFVFLVPFFAVLLSIYIIYKIARTIGQKKKQAVVSASCTATFPVLPFLASTAYTDVVGLLFLLLSTFFLIRWIQTDMTADSHILCAGLAVGLAAGTKLSMLYPAFAIALVATIYVIRSQKLWNNYGPNVEDIKLNWSWLMKKAVNFFSFAFIGGGFWYLRNLVAYGNPFYPVSMFGLPGRDYKAIVMMEAFFEKNPWQRLLYPWMEQIYDYQYDDGIGAVAAGIVIPALLLWPFLRNLSKKKEKQMGPGIVYTIAIISLLLFIWSNNMMMRMGIFAIAISFIMVGEMWKEVPSFALKSITVAAFFIMTTVITYDLAGGYIYQYLRNDQHRAERLHVPVEIDAIPASRIFNAAETYHTYGAMGSDYRHEVVTLFREVKPADVKPYKPSYVLLTKDKEEAFRAQLDLEFVGSTKTWDRPVTLWRIIRYK